MRKTFSSVMMKMKSQERSERQFRLKLQTFQFAPIQAKDDEAIKNLLNLMRDEQHGLHFVTDAELPEYSFVAIEPIWSSNERGNDINDEQTAVSMFQVGESEWKRKCTDGSGFLCRCCSTVVRFGTARTSRRVSALDSSSTIS